MDDRLLDYMIQRIENIDKKVDSLLQFKWQIVGGSVLMSIIATVLMQLFLK